MAMKNKRIIQLSTERLTLNGDDYVMVDSETDGSAKYRLDRLKETDSTLSVSGKAADAAATGQAISDEAEARENADNALDEDISDLKSALDFYTSDLSDEVEYINTGTANNTPSTYSFGFWLNIDADRLDINPELSDETASYTLKRYSVAGSVATGAAHTLTDTITNVVGDFSLYNVRKNDIVTIVPNSGYSKSVKVSDAPNGIGNLINISPADSLTLTSSYRFAGTYTIYTKTLEKKFNKLSFDDGIMSLSDLYGYNGNVFSFIPAISSKVFPSSALNSKLEDFESVLSDNNLSTITYPIRVRNSYGIALGDIKWGFPTAQGTAKFAVGYDINGVAIGRYTDTDLTSAEHGIPSNVYYMSFIYYTTVDYQALLKIIKDMYIVDVNGSGDYDSLIDCFVDLKDNGTEKTIYVLGGEYDIYEEMGGADYFNNISASATWLTESVFIPPNSHVIGLGKVTIKMILPTTIPAEKAIFFSPINIDRSATLENVNIVNLNNRYSIHIEGSKLAQNDNQIYKLKNVRCYRAADTSGVSDSTLVCGLNKGTYLDIENCQFISDNDHSIGFHDQSTEYDLSPSIHISDSVIVGGTKCCNLASTVRENMGTVIDTIFSNCYLSSDIRKIKNGTSPGTPKDVFKVVLLNTNVNIVNGGVTDEIVTEKYPPTV